MSLDLASALRRHLLQRFPADRDYPRDALHAPAMPPLVAAFLDRALDRWLEIERDGLRSDWFDFDDPAVQQAESRFFGVLAPTARVPAEAWEATLGGAIDLVVRFLTTPARALTDALFEGESDPLPTARLRERLSLFAAYLYFPEVAAAYLDKKQPETLDPDALFHLLDRIDRRIVREYGPDDWLALLEPLFALAHTVPEFDGIPASLLQRFFRAKDHDEVAEALDPYVGATVDEDMLRALLPGREAEPTEVAAVVPSTAEPAAEAPAPPPAAAAPDVEDDVEDDPVNNDAEAPDPEPVEDTSSDEAVPLWQRFAGGAAQPEASADDGEGSGDGESAPLWRRFANEPATAPMAAAPPAASPAAPPQETFDRLEARVLGASSSGRRARFVKQLFKGDERAYAAVLRTLDTTDTWTEASRVIARDVFRPYKINIYGEAAVDFTDAVEARYRS